MCCWKPVLVALTIWKLSGCKRSLQNAVQTRECHSHAPSQRDCPGLGIVKLGVQTLENGSCRVLYPCISRLRIRRIRGSATFTTTCGYQRHVFRPQQSDRELHTEASGANWFLEFLWQVASIEEHRKWSLFPPPQALQAIAKTSTGTLIPEDRKVSWTPEVDPNAAGETLIVYNIARTRPVPAVRTSVCEALEICQLPSVIFAVQTL